MSCPTCTAEVLLRCKACLTSLNRTTRVCRLGHSALSQHQRWCRHQSCGGAHSAVSQPESLDDERGSVLLRNPQFRTGLRGVFIRAETTNKKESEDGTAAPSGPDGYYSSWQRQPSNISPTHELILLLSTYPSIYRSIHVSIHPSTHPSIHPSLC